MFKELALKRESCRGYDGRPVPHELLQEILETACLSPSACNSQPWRLLAVEGETAEKLRPMVQAAGLNRFADKVSTFVVICETKASLKEGVSGDRQRFAQMDVGMVTMMLTLAAADQGVSTCILGCFRENKIKELLNIPEDVVVRLVVAMGYAEKEGVRKKVRKPYSETIGYQSW
ncbi:MAG: nitroreductase family protein [Clostridia bacterium]|nr:nitroreductase family protein [Clostridia bacterium]